MKPETSLLVAWHNEKQIQEFKRQWGLSGSEGFLILQQDKDKSGCAATKNKALTRAIDGGTDLAIILDDDCFPTDPTDPARLEKFITAHEEANQPQPVEMFVQVTEPQSRGTPYLNRHLKMPVAAAMGYWTGVPDFDAASQLVVGANLGHPTKIKCRRDPIFGRYFALSGMNVSFRPGIWWPWCSFINVPRWDDIWMGLLFQKAAYASGYCFSLIGPSVRHSRQSDVWRNLEEEHRYLRENEDLWRKIHLAPMDSCGNLAKQLLPHNQEESQ